MGLSYDLTYPLALGYILFGQHLLIQIRIFESGSLLKSFLQISLEQRNILRF